MISGINFTSKDVIASKTAQKAKNIASEYVSASKIYSAEERLAAENMNKPTRHPYVSPYITIQKAEDVNVDFIAETAPHRFNAIG